MPPSPSLRLLTMNTSDTTSDKALAADLRSLMHQIRRGDIEPAIGDLKKMSDSHRSTLLTARDPVGATLLHVAASENQGEVCTSLFRWGANLHARDRDGETPLHWAAARNAGQACSSLINDGIQIEMRDNAGETPFYKAVFAGSGEAMALLIDAGANTKTTNKIGVEALFWMKQHADLYDLYAACCAKKAIRSIAHSQVAP